jgi:hypothetical protein
VNDGCKACLMHRRQSVPCFGAGIFTYRSGATTSKEYVPMKSYVIAGLMIVGLASPALAAAQHYAVEDTVGNWSVIDARPSANLKILGNKGGYDSVAAAQKALGSGSGCKGMIDRA